MLAAPMARVKRPKAAAESPADDDGEEITTLKVYKRIAKKLSQVGALLNLSHPDVMARYEETIDEDLMELLAIRQAELAKRKPAGS